MAIYSEVGHVVLNTEHGIYPTADSEVAEVTAETKEEGYATHRWVCPRQTLHQSQFNIKSQPEHPYRPRWDSSDVIPTNHVT